MKLKLSDLKAFIDAASRLKTSSILPILGFVRLKDGVITQSDTKQYISMKADFEGECLIPQHILYSYAARSVGDVTVTQKENKITLTDGVTPVTCTTDDISLYPHPEQPSGVAAVFSEDICKAIGACSAPVLDDEINMNQVIHVFAGNGFIVGANQSWGLSYRINDNLPKSAFRRQEAEIIGRLPGCEFRETDKWHFFQTQNFTYGVIKSESKWYDLAGFFTPGDSTFTLDRSDIAGFCDTVTSICPGKDLLTSLQSQAGILTLEANDPSYEINVTRQVDCQADAPVFGFNPQLLGKLLKVMPADEYSFAPAKDMYHLVAGNRVGLIMRMELKTQ